MKMSLIKGYLAIKCIVKQKDHIYLILNENKPEDLLNVI